MPTGDVTTLIWGHRTHRPDPSAWQSNDIDEARSAVSWTSLRYAINYAIGMQGDRAAAGFHPWIRTPAGHIYSPVTVEVIAQAMDCRGRLTAFNEAKAA